MGRKRKRPSIVEGDKPGPPRKRPKDTSKVNQKSSTTTATPIGNTQQTHHHPVISRYYSQVVSLRTFLLSSLPSSSKSRRRKVASVGLQNASPTRNGSGSNPTTKLAHLLDTTLIGVLKQPDQATTQARQRDLASFTQSQARSTLDSTDTGPTCPQSEIVDFVILTLFNRPSNSNNGFKPQHLLCHGFQRAGPSHEYGAVAGNIPGVIPLFPNLNVSVLRKGPWAEVLGLLGRSGEEVMMRLLLDCGIFVSVDEGNGNYFQLSGVPLSELEVIDSSQKEGSRKKGGKSTTSTTSVLHTPGNIIFVRRRMLYARAVLNAKGEARFGLRHKHVLNRCSDISSLSKTVHLMKYIFPRQFGLHNVFTSRVDGRETVQPFKDYTVREDEIEAADRAVRLKKGLTIANGDTEDSTLSAKTKLPKRLRGELVLLIQKLQKRHMRCAYTELLKYYCPVENAPTPPSTQTSLTDFSTPASAVSAFCRATLLKLVPNELLYGIGEDAGRNREQISKFVDIFIRMRRFESLSLHQVLQGMKVTCIKWLEPPSCGDRKVSLSDLRKRTDIFQELVYYIFDSLLIPLIRSNFYVTESNVHRNRLFYFRHDVWKKLTEPTLMELKTSVFEEMPNDKAKHILNQRSLGFSQLRLLPKNTGARPIINLRRRVTNKFQRGSRGMLGPSINSLMTPVFNVFGYEKEQQPQKLGSAMFSVQDMYSRLREFQQKMLSSQLQTERKISRPLFFVKLDIKSCFDTIPQHKLVRLAERLVSEDEYRVTKHVEIRPPEGCIKGEGKPSRKFITKARRVADFSSIVDTVPDGKRHTVFVNTAMQKKHNTNNLLDLLEEHVRMNLVKIGKKYYRQKNGIPQGSILSSILCNFFYGALENDVLSFLHKSTPSDPHESLLLRLIDDFLLITTDRSRAVRFLELMIAGQPDYGVTVNPPKSLVNFPVKINNIAIPRCSIPQFPYCGSLINTHTLEISREDRPLLPPLQPNTSTYDSQPRSKPTVPATTSDTLTISTSQSPGHTFHRKSLSSFKLMSSNPMFLDTSHNSQKVVLKAIYGNFLTAAMRMERYLRELARQGSGIRSSLVIKTMGELMEMGVRVVRGKEKKGKGGFECSITNPQVRGLAVRAFGEVFGRKQTRYREVVRWLKGLER